MEGNTRRASLRRWKEREWESCEAALGYFRRLWQHALRNGLKPGDAIEFGVSDLWWLVQGHPAFETMTVEGFSHFTFRPDGRGNHRFALVDNTGVEHPFSTYAALTGFDQPLKPPVAEEDPFGGIVT